MFGLSVVLQSDDSLRLVGTIHLLSLGHNFLLKLDLLTLVHSRTCHLELHLVNVILGNFTPDFARLGALEFHQAMMTFTIRRSLDDSVGRGSEKRLLAMTHTRDVLDGTRSIQLLLCLGNGLQNRSPHQWIIQEVPIAGFRLGRCKLSHHNFLSTAGRSVHNISDLGSRNHGGTCIVPRIGTLIFVSIILDNPANVAIANPLARLFHIPSLRKLLLGLAVGRSCATSEQCVFLHLLVDVRSFPLVGVKKQTKLFHDYLSLSARMKTHFLA